MTDASAQSADEGGFFRTVLANLPTGRSEDDSGLIRLHIVAATLVLVVKKVAGARLARDAAAANVVWGLLGRHEFEGQAPSRLTLYRRGAYGLFYPIDDAEERCRVLDRLSGKGADGLRVLAADLRLDWNDAWVAFGLSAAAPKETNDKAVYSPSEGVSWPHRRGGWTPAELDDVYRMRYRYDMSEEAIAGVVGVSRSRINVLVGKRSVHKAAVEDWPTNWRPSAELRAECGTLKQ